ncbi:MAG: tungstate ABC transporter substrate-binding protein WtpA [Candidatus Delongbacteria bacterium]|nr:tungstate ABC transporter substrate-binding protein WtpA [Candidatus Delongbacteria bacterium]
MKKMYVIIFSLVISLTCAFAQEASKEKTKISIFHAGSLSKPFKDMKEAFEAKYPQTELLMEGAGSRACARKITDLKQNCEVMASADEIVITSLLFPDYADYCLNFVTNEMVIMYNDDAKFGNEINSKKWYEVLLKEGVEYGHSEPEKDPCGYRTLLAWQLAEKFYNLPGLYEKLQKKGPQKNVRAKEVDLLALLDAGEIDYLFIYKSVAEQHKHKYVSLPAEVNLGSASLNEYYSTASVKLTGKTPEEKVTVKGAAMVYGITVPKNAKYADWGIKYLEFVIGPEGQRIMAKNGHPVLNPAESGQFDKLPPELQKSTKSIK